LDATFGVVTPGRKRKARIHAIDPGVHLFSMDGRVKPGHDDNGKSYAAFASEAFVSAKAQSIHRVSSATSFASTVAPHQMRKPAGASR